MARFQTEGLSAGWNNGLNKGQTNRLLNYEREKIMDLLMTLGIVLLILWLLGLVTSYTLGGFIHVLLVLALVVLVIQLISGRRAAL